MIGPLRRLIIAALALSGAAMSPVSAAPALEPAANPASLWWQPAKLPSFEAVRAAHRSAYVDILDRHGELLQRQRVDHKVRQLAWLPLDAFSIALVRQVLQAEDREFYQHAGIDWAAVARSGWHSVRAALSTSNQRTKRAGASTLTMQLAGLLDERLRPSAQGRSPLQKAAQLQAAQQLEHSWRKDQILEAYLNLVPMRGETRGLPAFTRTYWQRSPDGLEREPAAIAAALIRAPNAPWPSVQARACRLLNEAAGSSEAHELACTGLSVWAGASEGRSRIRTSAFDDPSTSDEPSSPHLAPHLAPRLTQRITSSNGPITTTLDATIQRSATVILQQQVRRLRNQGVEDAAVLVLNNRDGAVLAWVGGSGANSRAAEVDMVSARRQAGSTLKPFVYATALDMGLITAASLLEDSPIALPVGAGTYTPQNYNRQYRGPVSARVALASSLNIPAVRTLMLTGVAPVYERLQQLGFALPQAADHYGYSLALGSADITLLQLTNAYRALANDGKPSPVHWIAEPAATPPPSPTAPVFSPATVAIVRDILSDNSARSISFGLDSALVTRRWSAVKTGTSKDMRDNWCIGFDDHVTIGVWVGNARGEPMRGVSGVSGAAPIWQRLMNDLQSARPANPAPRFEQALASTPKLVARQVSFEGTAEAPRREWFIAGSEREHVQALQVISPLSHQSSLAPKILHPSDNSLIALDPDIPMRAQRLLLSAQGVPQPIWKIDGQRLRPSPNATSTPLWTPTPGRHEITLLAGTSEVDRVVIEVRLPPVKGGTVRGLKAPMAPSSP